MLSPGIKSTAKSILPSSYLTVSQVISKNRGRLYATAKVRKMATAARARAWKWNRKNIQFLWICQKWISNYYKPICVLNFEISKTNWKFFVIWKTKKSYVYLMDLNMAECKRIKILIRMFHKGNLVKVVYELKTQLSRWNIFCSIIFLSLHILNSGTFYGLKLFYVAI